MSHVDFHTKIVGVSHPNPDGTSRQDLIEELEDLVAQQGSVTLTLMREALNPHDTHAVAVLDPKGRQLGYLAAKVAEGVAPLMDSHVQLRSCVASITGGGLTMNYGVNIRIWSL